MKRNSLTATPPVHLHLRDFQVVNVTLVGCGGTGSHLASGLVSLLLALEERGIRAEVVLIDGDVVEDKNVGRQLFSRADVGRPKATVVADRLNQAFGTKIGSLWRTICAEDAFVYESTRPHLDLVIGAVDNAAARRLMTRAVENARGALWYLDCGNDHHSGQVGLGNVTNARDLRGAVALGMVDRLPAPSLTFSDLLKRERADRVSPGDRRPPARGAGRHAQASCAELAASGEQGLMVNRMVAAWALELLHAFLIGRDPKWFALAFDLTWGGTRAYTLDAPTLAEVTGLRGDQLVVRQSEGKK